MRRRRIDKETATFAHLQRADKLYRVASQSKRLIGRAAVRFDPFPELDRGVTALAWVMGNPLATASLTACKRLWLC